MTSSRIGTPGGGLRARAGLFVAGVAAAIALAALVYDPRAEAAEPKRVLGLALAAAGFAWWIARRAPHRRVSWGARAALAFVGLSALSFLWGLPSGARDLGTWVTAIGAGAIAARLGPRLGARLARLAALATGTIAAGTTLAAAAGGARGMALHGGQGNPNWLGLLLAITLPLSLDAAIGWWRAGDRKTRALLAGAIVAQAGALVLSHSRVGWLAAVVACGWLVFRAARLRGGRRAAFAVALFAILLAAPRASADGDVPVDLALRGRAWIWHGTAQATMRALPFGVGLGRFGHAYLEAQGRDLARLTPGEAARRFVNATTAHEDYLQAAVESGPLAALLLAWALLLAMRDHARARFFGGAAALGATMILALGDSPLHQPGVAILVGLVMGVPLRRAPIVARRVVPAIVGLVATGALLAGATRGWLATRERTSAMDAEPAARLALLAKSARLDPDSGEAALDLGLARLAIGDAKGALAPLRRADELLADTGARIAIGSALLASGNALDAEPAYRAALAYDPGSFRARIGLAEALLALGKLELAGTECDAARRVMPGDPRGRELADRIHEGEMDR